MAESAGRLPPGAPPGAPRLPQHRARGQRPAPDQEVLRLWAWEQLAPREIAVVLAITPNAASIRLHRATAKLREALRKDDGPAGHLGQRQGTEVEQ